MRQPERTLPRIEPMYIKINQRIVYSIERIGQPADEADDALRPTPYDSRCAIPHDERKRETHHKTLIDGIEGLNGKQRSETRDRQEQQQRHGTDCKG